MNLSRSHIAGLLLKEATEQLSPEESAELQQWKWDSGATDQELRELTSVLKLKEQGKVYAEAHQRAEHLTFSVVDAQDVGSQGPAHRVHLLRRGWFRYAAAILLLVGAGAYFYTFNSKKPTSEIASNSMTPPDIQPGTNKAILTTGDESINLSNHKSGIMTANNAITYNDGERIANAGQMLTLTTPRGGQYQAVLPDGTKVWLNAASSIRFPSKFAHEKREVEVTGEVYMEVAQNLKSPFAVKAGKTTVQVLGTSFNINAYGNEESLKTTLISGSVKVLSDGQEVILRPGEAAEVREDIKVSIANIEQVIAWKNGYFSFENMSLVEMSKQIERWYDIDILFEGKHMEVEPRGKMDRGVKLSDVIQFFNNYGFNTRLEGRILILTGK